jgi:hypothetical protein
MAEHQVHEGGSERMKLKRAARKEAQQPERDWTRDHFLADLNRVSRRITREIESDPAQAAALDRSREQAREGKLISQEEFDRESNDGE